MEQSRRNLLKSFTALAGASLLPSEVQSQIKAGSSVLKKGDPIDLSEFVNLYDFEKNAESKMTKMAFEYLGRL